MPTTYNGCGTWYYGRGNVEQHQGSCQLCNHFTTLTSYDTRLWVVVLMIPVIPVKRLRIIEECAACRRHRAMPLRDWNDAHARLEAGIANYRQSPTDATLAREAVAACVGYRDLRALDTLAAEVEKNLGDQAKTLVLLAAARVSFGNLVECERLLRLALALEDQEDTRELLADVLMRQGKPDEAAPFVDHVIQKCIPDRVGHLYHLAQRYQMNGSHEKALAAFELCLSINPAIGNDETFKRLHQASRDAAGTARAVNPNDVLRKAKTAAAWRKFAVVAPVVLALALMGYLLTAWLIGQRRTVHLVNGLERAYQANVNGVVHTLQPDSVTTIRLPEGSVRFSIVDAPPPFTQQTVVMESPFWSRPFADHAFVINPDGAAILDRMRAHYRPKGQSGRPPEHHLMAGLYFYHERDIDCPFEDLPRELSTESPGSVSRVGLFLTGPRRTHIETSVFLANIRDQIGEKTTWDVAMRHLLLEPEKTDLLSVIDDEMPAKELADFLRDGLERRPVELPWHRVFQRAMEKSGQHSASAELYRRMLTREPANKDLMFLLGRAVEDYDESVRLVNAAAEGDDASPTAVSQLGHNAMAAGRWVEAVAAGRRAVAAAPKDPEMARLLGMALIAQRSYDEAISLARQIQAMPPPKNWWGFYLEAMALHLMGRTDKVPDTISRLQKIWTPFGPTLQREASEMLEAMGDYVVGGDAAKWASRRRNAVLPEEHLEADLTAGDLAAAEESLKRIDHKSQFHLIIHLIASRQDKPDIAAAHLAAAADELSRTDADGRIVARALKGDTQVRVEEVLRTRHRTDMKAVTLIALGTIRPAWREPCFTLARQVNDANPTFPHLLLKEFLATGRAPNAVREPTQP